MLTEIIKIIAYSAAFVIGMSALVAWCIYSFAEKRFNAIKDNKELDELDITEDFYNDVA